MAEQSSLKGVDCARPGGVHRPQVGVVEEYGGDESIEDFHLGFDGRPIILPEMIEFADGIQCQGFSSADVCIGVEH